MEEMKNPLEAQECFYLRTSLDWMDGQSQRLDKCVVLVVERGDAALLVEEKEYAVDAGQMAFLGPGIPVRKLRSSDNFMASLAAFPPFMLRDVAQRLEPRFMLHLFSQVVWGMGMKGRRFFRHFMGLFRFAMDGYGSGFTRELVQKSVDMLLFGFYELYGSVQMEAGGVESSRSRELFRNFIGLLHECYTREHEVQFYAAKLCISAKYLTQVTKAMLGHTPKQIIDETLLQEAMKMLDQNNSSIQDISASLGFPDQSYFGRFFKRMKLMSPQQYRLRAKR